ncbi:MAG: helix-turn-helix transcriptional regulator [Bifidobacterium sp.]|uniref:Helix-turn-helix transcriptional regulator n=1 Tax=Bifidobacterium fermentum TaxID=3059035 RepID=A0AB39UR42_9BIFI
MITEQQELAKRAATFVKYVSSELKGAISSRGYNMSDIADALDRPRPTMTNWLNGKAQIRLDVAQEICEYIGMEIQEITARAYTRVINELGPWPPIEVNPDQLSEDEKKRLIMEKVRRGDMSLAANYDPDKEAERDYYPDAGA